MKTTEQLECRIKELGKQAADFSFQAVEIREENREQSKVLMRRFLRSLQALSSPD